MKLIFLESTFFVQLTRIEARVCKNVVGLAVVHPMSKRHEENGSTPIDLEDNLAQYMHSSAHLVLQFHGFVIFTVPSGAKMLSFLLYSFFNALRVSMTVCIAMPSDSVHRVANSLLLHNIFPLSLQAVHACI